MFGAEAAAPGRSAGGQDMGSSPHPWTGRVRATVPSRCGYEALRRLRRTGAEGSNGTCADCRPGQVQRVRQSILGQMVHRPCARCKRARQVIVTQCPTAWEAAHLVATYQGDSRRSTRARRSAWRAWRGGPRGGARATSRDLRVRRHDRYWREGTTSSVVRFDREAASADRRAATLDGDEDRRAGGTQPGREWLRNRGVPRLQGPGRGDLGRRSWSVREDRGREAALLRAGRQARELATRPRRGFSRINRVLLGGPWTRPCGARRPRLVATSLAGARRGELATCAASGACGPGRWSRHRTGRRLAIVPLASGPSLDVAGTATATPPRRHGVVAPPKGDRLEWLVRSAPRSA